MFKILRRILAFCGPRYAGRIRTAYVFSFLKSFFANAPVMAGVFLLGKLMAGEGTWILCIEAAGILLVSLALGAVFQNLADRTQSSAGYEVFAEKRLEFAEHLRRLPMGCFSTGNMGRISSILSDDMVQRRPAATISSCACLTAIRPGWGREAPRFPAGRSRESP